MELEIIHLIKINGGQKYPNQKYSFQKYILPTQKKFFIILQVQFYSNLEKSFDLNLQYEVLTPSEISLSYKHYFALKRISKLNEPALVVEDDIV